MPPRATPLSAQEVKAASPGRLCDGGATGLYLFTRDAEHKFWLFRYTRAGKMREMGLGPAVGPSMVSLAEARDKARDLYKLVKAGRDPLDEKKEAKAKIKAESAKAINRIIFRAAADTYLNSHKDGWKNPKHRQQWENTLATYVYPKIGDLPVAEVDTGHVTQIIEPLWRAKPETASRIRGRIETILNAAKVRGWRDGENPARWKGHFENILPARKRADVKHHVGVTSATS